MFSADLTAFSVAFSRQGNLLRQKVRAEYVSLFSADEEVSLVLQWFDLCLPQ